MTIVTVTADLSDTNPTTTQIAPCPTGSHAIAGGGSTTASNVEMTGSYPSTALGAPVTSGTNPVAWTATFDGSSNTNSAYAICAPS